MWYYCRPFSHTCLPICLPAMALHPGACFRNFPNWFRSLGHVRDNNGCLVVHQHPCSQLFKCQNGGKAPKSHPRGGNWVLAALVTVVVSFAGVSCVGVALVGDAHSKHKCWVFCAMSRRTFVSLHYFPSVCVLGRSHSSLVVLVLFSWLENAKGLGKYLYALNRHCYTTEK